MLTLSVGLSAINYGESGFFIYRLNVKTRTSPKQSPKNGQSLNTELPMLLAKACTRTYVVAGGQDMLGVAEGHICNLLPNLAASVRPLCVLHSARN